MKISHVKALSDEDIRVEVKSNGKHYPVKINITKEDNIIGFEGTNLFTSEKEFGDRIKHFAMSKVASIFK